MGNEVFIGQVCTIICWWKSWILNIIFVFVDVIFWGGGGAFFRYNFHNFRFAEQIVWHHILSALSLGVN